MRISVAAESLETSLKKQTASPQGWAQDNRTCCWQRDVTEPSRYRREDGGRQRIPRVPDGSSRGVLTLVDNLQSEAADFKSTTLTLRHVSNRNV